MAKPEGFATPFGANTPGGPPKFPVYLLPPVDAVEAVTKPDDDAEVVNWFKLLVVAVEAFVKPEPTLENESGRRSVVKNYFNKKNRIEQNAIGTEFYS